MPILKPIDNTFVCPVNAQDLDAILKSMFGYTGIRFIETDAAGAHFPGLDPYGFFAVNRVLVVRPIETKPSNRYSSFAYDCLLTIARPADVTREVETNNAMDGQFDTITKELISPAFINTLKSYFTCCDYGFSVIAIRPIWNSTTAVKGVNHSGIEINLTLTI